MERYFIGITLPDGLNEQIARIQQDLLTDSTHTMQPLQPHITLLNPNELARVSPMYTVQKSRELAKPFFPFIIRLTGTDMFDGRVLYLAVESPQLNALHDALSVIIPERERAKYRVGRSFDPHATLVQAKPKQNLDPELVANFRTRVEPLLPYSFQATALTKFDRLQPRTYRTREL